jgi:hypothetical protein
MNDWDRDNLNFLLSTDKKELNAWYDQCDEDDIRYALELLKAHKTELILQELEYYDQVESVACAANLLSKFANT